MSDPRPGDRTRGDALTSGVYDRLRARARRLMALERRTHTLQPTALVHEVWARVLRVQRGPWHGPTHLLAVGVQAMRRVLMDQGRQRKRLKRGAGAEVVPLSRLDVAAATPPSIDDRLALAHAIERLAAIDPRQADVVRLRASDGLTVAEVARALGVSTRTVEDEWRHACAWLRREVRSTR